MKTVRVNLVDRNLDYLKCSWYLQAYWDTYSKCMLSGGV